ncbi:MAG: hypothetical protein KDC66_22470 [Phaeodactylibacter sp.]|nr:hypothetical protein [Phaeodactylibacter sp.]
MAHKQKLLGLILALSQAKEEADDVFPPGASRINRKLALDENYGTLVFWAIGRFRDDLLPGRVLELVEEFLVNQARQGRILYSSEEPEGFRRLTQQFVAFVQAGHRDTET